MPTTPSSPTLDDFASLLRGYRPSSPQESLGSDFLRSQAMAATNITTTTREEEGVLLILLPLLIVLSTVLFLILVFLVCVILLKRKRGIRFVPWQSIRPEEGERGVVVRRRRRGGGRQSRREAR